MMIDNDQMQKGHDCQLGFDGWIIADIKKSGLAPDNFTADPLRDEEELKRRLGFTQISNIPIMSVGGYWIPYPNVSEYFRLKLREEIKTEDGNIRYLSPQKELGKGNHAYILQDVGQLLKSYNPDKPIFITEGEKKSVKASIEGFPCIGLSGVWNFKDSENDFLPELGNFVWTDRDVFIVFDSDITEKHNVRHAEIRLAVELTNRGARVFSIRLPNESDGDKNGLDDYLERYGKEKFQELINSVKPTLELHVEEDTINRLMLTELHNLRNGIEREKILKLLTKREGVSFETVKSEFYKNRPEKEKSGTEEKVSTPEETKKVEEELYTPEEIEKAKALLKSQDILGEMMKHTECSGHVGEEINKEMLYLSFTSRKMDKAISCIIKGASASGKNALTDCILQLMPKEDVLKYSLLTSKALAHFSGNLSHKILYVAEHAGSESANYSVRTVISEGEISIALPVKDETTNDFETMEKRIEAKGLCFIETTTTERIHPENQTRLFDLFIDESSAQTALILNSHTQIVDIEKVEKERRVWQALQSLLEPYNVIVPFTKALISVFPTDKIRVRRDFPRFLSLIKAHALLYQYQREKDGKGNLLATTDDLKGVVEIAEKIFVQSYKELSPKLEKLLNEIKANFKIDQEFTFGELEEKTEYKERTLRSYLKTLAKLDFLSHNGKTGKESRYSLQSNLASIASMGNFGVKLSKLLEEIEAKMTLPQSALMPQSEIDINGNKADRGNEANRGKNDFASIKDNDKEDLHQKKAFEAKRQNTIKEGVSNPKDELDFSRSKPQSDYEIQEIRYSDDDIVYQLERLDKDGKPLIRIVTPDSPEFETVRREYERQSR